MIRALFDKDGHLNEETLTRLKFGTLKEEEMISVLEHISDCQKCAAVLADSFEDNELAEAPLGFEEKVQVKMKSKKISNIQFGFYCAKVAIAASIALMMVFSNGLNFLVNTKSSDIKSPDLSIVNSINAKLSIFSERVIKMEVFDNDKEKK